LVAVEQPSGTVTFLFTDIEGSTRLLRELGRDSYGTALEEHRRLLRGVFGRHGGFEVDSQGDGFFVAFQAAGAAVAAAAEVQQVLASHPWPDGRALRVRIGVHSGEPMLAPPKYVGLEVHKAARIMAAGHGGQVLLSQATRGLIEIDVHDLGFHRLKDLDEPVHLFQLGRKEFPPLRSRTPIAPPAAPIQSSVLEDEILGREEELARIDGFLNAATAPAALVLEGDAGIGKTTLWAAGVRLAGERSFRVLACRPSAAETTFSFAGLGDLLGPVLEESPIELPALQRNALEAALLLDQGAGVPPDERVIALALLSQLRLLARQQPVLVAVDDAQWLDRPSSAVLEFALRRLVEDRVLLLVCVRRQPSEPPLALERSLGEDRQRLLVGPMSLGALHRIVVSRLGRSLSRPTLVRVHEVSGGNPFYALEIARAVLARPEALEAGSALPMPATLEELVRARLDGLPQEVRQALEPAALLAEPTVTMLEAASPEPEQLGERLDQAVAAGVIELDGERIDFTHPLLAAAAASMIGPRRRRRLHEQLAGLVGEPEQRARHLALATSQPSSEIADAIEAGANAAGRRGASAAAADLLELAANRTPDEQRSDRWRRRIDAAREHIAAEAPARAIELVDRLLEEMPAGPERADALVLRAKYSMDDFDASALLFEQALLEAHGDDRRSVEIHVARGHYAADIAVALEHARAALAVAEKTADPKLLIPTLATVATHETWAGIETPGLLERAIELERGAPSVGYTDAPRFALALRYMCRDRLDEARALFDALIADAAAVDDELATANAVFHLAELECRAGNLQAASVHAARLYERAEQLGIERQGCAPLYIKALVDAHLGRVDEARAAAEEGLANAIEIGDDVFRIQNLAALGFLELSLGRVTEADVVLRPTPLWLIEHGWNEPSTFPVWPNAIEALTALGELENAHDYLALYAARAERCDCPWALATGARCRGLLAAAAGELGAALAAFEEALVEHERMPGPFERGRTLLALGATQHRAKQKRAARDSLEAALAIFEEVGAPLWAEKARAELKRIGGRARGPAELTETERRVAELVGEGKSNRDVAAELYVTVRTVEWNLTKVYGKLDIRSRTELARKLANDRRR
jgi:class 3 adenylate cyclase/DNA-binding CsgD family transcriptional regulator